MEIKSIVPHDLLTDVDLKTIFEEVRKKVSKDDFRRLMEERPKHISEDNSVEYAVTTIANASTKTAKGDLMGRLHNELTDYYNSLTTDIKKCARCGGEHDRLILRPMANADWTHWAMCPTLGQPIMVNVSDTDKQS